MGKIDVMNMMLEKLDKKKNTNTLNSSNQNSGSFNSGNSLDWAKVKQDLYSRGTNIPKTEADDIERKARITIEQNKFQNEDELSDALNTAEEARTARQKELVYNYANNKNALKLNKDVEDVYNYVRDVKKINKGLANDEKKYGDVEYNKDVDYTQAVKQKEATIKDVENANERLNEILQKPEELQTQADKDFISYYANNKEDFKVNKASEGIKELKEQKNAQQAELRKQYNEQNLQQVDNGDVVNEFAQNYNDPSERLANSALNSMAGISGGVAGVIDWAKDAEYQNRRKEVEKNLYAQGKPDKEVQDYLSQMDKENFDVNDPNNLYNRNKAQRDKLAQGTFSGLTDDEMFRYQAYHGAINNLINYGVFGGFVGAVGGSADAISNAITLGMAGQSATDAYFENRAKGLDVGTSSLNAGLKGTVSFLTERLPTENFIKVWTTPMGKLTLGKLAKQTLFQGLEEGAEEGAEYLGDLAIDALTTVNQQYGGDVTKLWEIMKDNYDPDEITNSMELGFASGLLISMPNNVRGFIGNVKQYNTFAEVSKSLGNDIQTLNNAGDYEGAQKLQQTKDGLDLALSEFDEKASNVSKGVSFSSDVVKEGSIENGIQDFDSAIEPDYAAIERRTSEAKEISQALLYQRGVNADIDEYMSWSPEVRQNIIDDNETVQKLTPKGYTVTYTDLGNDVNGMYLGKGNIVINPTTNMPLTTIVHELTHSVEKGNLDTLTKVMNRYLEGVYNGYTRNESAYEKLGMREANEQGKTFADWSKSYRLRLDRAYVDQIIKNNENPNNPRISYNSRVLSSEYLANTVERTLGTDKDFIRRMVRYDSNFVYRIYQKIKSIANPNNELIQLEKTMFDAFRSNDINPETGVKYAVNFDKAFDENSEVSNTDSEGNAVTKETKKWFNGTHATNYEDKLMKMYRVSDTVYDTIDSAGKGRKTFVEDNVNYYTDNKHLAETYANVAERGKRDVTQVTKEVAGKYLNDEARKHADKIEDKISKINGAINKENEKFNEERIDTIPRKEIQEGLGIFRKMDNTGDSKITADYYLEAINNFSKTSSSFGVSRLENETNALHELLGKLVRAQFDSKEYVKSINSFYSDYHASDYQITEKEKNKIKKLWDAIDKQKELLKNISNREFVITNELEDKISSLKEELKEYKAPRGNYEYSGYIKTLKPVVVDGHGETNFNSLNRDTLKLTNKFVIPNKDSEALFNTQAYHDKTPVEIFNDEDRIKEFDHYAQEGRLRNKTPRDKFEALSKKFADFEEIALQNPAVLALAGETWGYTDNVVRATLFINEKLREKGLPEFDSVVFKNIIDNGGQGEYAGKDILSNVIATIGNNKFKSFDNLNPTDTNNMYLSVNMDKKNQNEKLTGTVAPYYNAQWTSEGGDKLFNDIETQYFDVANKILKELDIKIDNVFRNIGGYTYDADGNSTVEPSYTFQFNSTNEEQENKFKDFMYLMADLGHENQESVIISKYVNSNDTRKGLSNEVNVYHNEKNNGKVVSILKSLGINDFTVNDGIIRFYIDEVDEAFDKKLESLYNELGENYYGKTTINKTETIFANRENRRNTYQERLSRSDSGEQNRYGWSDTLKEFYNEAINSIENEFSKIRANEGSFAFDDNGVRLSVNDNVSETQKVIDYINSTNMSQEQKDQMIRDIAKYGAIEKGESPKKDVYIPNKIDVDGETKNISKGIRTMLEAGKMNADQETKVLENIEDFAYAPKTIKKFNNDAQEHFNEIGKDNLFSEYMASKGSQRDMANGIYLLNVLENENDPRADVVRVKLVSELSDTAQTLSLISRMYKRLTPEGYYQALNAWFSRVQNQWDAKYKDKTVKGVVNQDLLEKYVNAKTEVERKEIEQKIKQDFKDQEPQTLLNKLNEIRYLAMLGNIRTHIRNLAGNSVMGIMAGIKDVVATGIEAGTNKTIDVLNAALKKDIKHIDRQKAILNSSTDKALIDYGREMYDVVKYEIEKNAKYEGISTKGAFSNKNPFGKTLNFITRLNSRGLDVEDFLFSKARFSRTFAEYLKAKNLSKGNISPAQLDAACEYSLLEAEKATFRDFNVLANTMNNLANKSKVFRFVKDAIVPFTTTPFNIVKRGVEYSPLGLIKSLTWNVRELSKGNINANQFIDNIASGLTGTGLTMLGYILAKHGWFRTKDDDSDRKNEFDKENGEQDYAITLPNGATYTIDWLTPAIMPMAMGAEIFNAFGNLDGINGMNGVEMAKNIAGKVIDPIIETSMLKSVKESLQSFQNEGGGYFVDVINDAVASYISQYFPTLGGQLARVADDTRRNVRSETLLETTGRKILNKIPYASKLNEPYINKQGKEEKQEDLGMDWVGRLFLNAISPGYYKSKNVDKYDEEMNRLYKATGEAGVIPSAKTKDFTSNDIKYKLYNEEYTNFARTKYKAEDANIKELMDSQNYSNLDDASKASVITKIRNLCLLDAKAEDLAKRGIKLENENDEYKNWYEAKQSGISMSEFVLSKMAYNDSKGLKDSEGNSLTQSTYVNKINSLGMNDKEKNVMYDEYYGESKFVNIVNTLDISDKQKYAIKEAKALASDTLDFANRLKSIGMLDTLVKYCDTNGIAYSKVGLSKAAIQGKQTTKKKTTTSSSNTTNNSTNIFEQYANRLSNNSSNSGSSTNNDAMKLFLENITK